MKKSYENENPSKVIITPKPPKGDPEAPDASSAPKPVQDVIPDVMDILKPGSGPVKPAAPGTVK
ncbi:MAG: hypothetical protein IJK05_02520 [Bacteroidales bacterium]|nr:hypothetical protein [Bacteroidales bacterium]